MKPSEKFSRSMDSTRPPKRKSDTRWNKFIEVHLALMWGCDFFTHEIWTTTKGKLLTYYFDAGWGVFRDG